MNRVAAFALRRKNSILSMSEKMFCPPQPLRFWITPAYTGKRIKLRKRHSICGDHPRVCGEKFSSVMRQTSRRGSPPRVRGKELHPVCVGGTHGITPACAGKRAAPGLRRWYAWDHPRMCGEKALKSWLMSGDVGSPPHVRGKAGRQLGIGGLVGIIPACAGKRLCALLPMSQGKDHPRVCGEKFGTQNATVFLLGSPPRVRGKVRHPERNGFFAGITPARAGKRQTGRTLMLWSGDHPRVCEEKFHPASDRKLGRVQGTKRSSGPAPAAAPAGLAGSCPASPPWSYPPCITVSRPRP